MRASGPGLKKVLLFFLLHVDVGEVGTGDGAGHGAGGSEGALVVSVVVHGVGPRQCFSSFLGEI